MKLSLQQAVFFWNALVMISYHSGFCGGPFVPGKDPNVAGNLDMIINQSVNQPLFIPKIIEEYSLLQ